MRLAEYGIRQFDQDDRSTCAPDQTCPTCSGDGWVRVDEHETEECRECQGAGEVAA